MINHYRWIVLKILRYEYDWEIILNFKDKTNEILHILHCKISPPPCLFEHFPQLRDPSHHIPLLRGEQQSRQESDQVRASCGSHYQHGRHGALRGCWVDLYSPDVRHPSRTRRAHHGQVSPDGLQEEGG